MSNTVTVKIGEYEQVFQLIEKTADNPFKSGSRGFWGGGKFKMNGKRYQVSCSIVEIGSKPKP